jgi:hypothetical protein
VLVLQNRFWDKIWTWIPTQFNYINKH